MNEMEPSNTPSPLVRPESQARGSLSSSVPIPKSSLVISEVTHASGTESSFPCVFDFRDYREFLRQWYQHKKRIQPGYTGGMFAKKAGIQAHTLFNMVARGERNLGYATSRGFAKALGLKAREATYFEKLVLLNQARTPEERKTYLQELLTAAASAGSGSPKAGADFSVRRALERLTQIKDHAEYLSHWYIVVIREMAALEAFREDPEWISARLKKRVTSKQVRQALDLLLKIGQLSRDDSGRLAIQHPAVDIDPGGVDYAIRNIHKEFLDLARQSLDEDPLNEREFSSLTITVSAEDLPLLSQRIGEFRKQLNLEFTEKKDRPKTHTVAINLQSLVLSLPEENSPKDSPKNSKGERK